MTDQAILSDHFSLTEFEHSDTAFAKNIPNLLPPSLIPAARALCGLVLEPIRAHFGVPVVLNSGYRSPMVNAAVGSKPGSQHMRAEAADIEIPTGPSNAELAAWIAGSGLPFDQLILENYHQGQPRSGWVHVSHSLAGPQRKSILTMVMMSHGPVYLNGLHP